MRRLCLIGSASLAIILAACLWLRSLPGAAPVRVVTAPIASITDNGARIVYRPGHYPQLRATDGAIHPIHSLLNVPHALAFGDYVWDAQGIAAGQAWVRIDLASQIISVFRGSDEIGTAVIIYGTDAKPTPSGLFHVLAKDAYYYSRTYDAPMPYALRLTADGVALHASTVREHSATHGCIGLPPGFARLLYDEMNKGDRVEILPATSATRATNIPILKRG